MNRKIDPTIRIILGIVVTLMGIYIWKGGEYFIGVVVTILGVSLALGIRGNWDNTWFSASLGIFFWIGALLSFFSPELASSPSILGWPPMSPTLYKLKNYTGGVLFTLAGIFFIFQAIRYRKKK